MNFIEETNITGGTKLTAKQFVAGDICICPAECDCQNPEPDEGVAGVSELCSEHNLRPLADPDCMAVVHHNGAR